MISSDISFDVQYMLNFDIIICILQLGHTMAVRSLSRRFSHAAVTSPYNLAN
jgi:hypothetical protein